MLIFVFLQPELLLGKVNEEENIFYNPVYLPAGRCVAPP
jgi:hypothetical protein